MVAEKYTYTFRPESGFYQGDVNGRMKLSAMLRLSERAAGEHLDSIGMSYEKLFLQGQIFLLAKLGLKVLRAPNWKDEIVVRTAPQANKGAQFGREIIVETSSGERLVEIHTTWLLVEPTQRKILRPSEFDFNMETIPENISMPAYSGERIRPQGEVISVTDYTVRYSAMDVNCHLNNTVYGDIVTDNVPFDDLRTRFIDSFNINYQHEAVEGDVLEITTSRSGETEYFVVGKNVNKNEDCFVARLILGSIPAL